MNNNKEYSERRGSLIILTVLVLIIIVVTFVGILVLLFVDKYVAKIILFCLIGFLVILAAASFFFVELRRKEAQRARDFGATELVNQMFERQRQHMEAGPPPYTIDSQAATWALTQPWRQSQRSSNRTNNV